MTNAHAQVIYTTWDKFANFGGNFGIFAEITGASMLGMINFILLVIKLASSKAILACKNKVEKMKQQRERNKSKANATKVKVTDKKFNI